MDIENGISPATTRPNSGITGNTGRSVVAAAEATHDTPVVETDLQTSWMPSAEAIADAIVRRALTDYRS